MLLAMTHARGNVNIFNLGTDEYCTVDDSIGWICDYLGLAPKRIYAGGDRGWVGDNPFIHLDVRRIHALGWRARLGIQEGILRTIAWLAQNRWVLGRRT